MSSGKSSAPVQRADLRAWLEAAIASADAALKPKIPSTATSEAETVAESSAASSGHKRKLVTVRRITAVTGIQKDNNMVEIDGWKVVVEKAKGFAKDSYVLFLEMDSFLPAHSPFEDLFCEAGPLVTFDGEDGYRVGTSAWTDWDGNEIVSQGHIFHLLHFRDINQKVCDLHFEHIHQTNEEFAGLLRGIDFTDDLGVKKWESFPETPATNTSEGSMIVEAATSNPKPPSFIIKADMERVQNCPNLFKKPKYQHFVFQESLKMDGSTMAVYFIPNDSPLFSDLPTLPAPDYSNKDTFLRYAVHPTGRLGVCTRQQDLLPHLLPSRTVPAHAHFWAAAVAANIHKLLPALNKPVAVHAELVGATVQGNPYAYPAGQHELFVFSISDLNPPPSPTGPNNGAIITASRRWHPRRVEQFAADKGLKHVPVLGYHTIPSVARHHQDLVDRAELKKGEGLVFKNCADGRWFKVLSSRWIREKGDEMHARKQAAAAKKGGGKGHDDVDGEARAGGKDGDGREALGWWVSKEEADRVREVFANLEDWIQRDDGLRMWMEEWEKGFHRGDEKEAKSGGAVEINGRAGDGGMNGKPVSAGAKAENNGQKASGFGVSAAKRKELEAWLRIDCSSL